MSIFTKNIISEKALLLWVIYTFAATLVSLLVASIIIYFVYDCWPLSRYQFNGGICLEKIQPHYIKFIPIIFGIISGSILAFKSKD